MPVRIIVYATGARRGAGAGFNRVLTMAREFPELRPEDRFLFVVRPELADAVREAAPRAELVCPPKGLPSPLRIAWDQSVAPLLLAKWRPDVIFGAFNMMPLWVAGRRPRSVVMITNLLPFSDERKADKGGTRMATEMVRVLTRLSIRRADRVLLLSSLARQLVGEGVLEGKEWILPPAVPRSLPNIEARPTDGAPVFVVAADLIPHKSVETAIRALDSSGIPDARLKIFGRPSNQRYVAALRSEVSRLGLDDAVEMGRWIDRKELLQEMAGSIACIAPSRFENLSHVLAEAFAAGSPLLAADIPGSREVCGDAALFFAPGDERALAGLMGKVVAEPRLRETLIRRGADRYRGMAAKDQSAVILATLTDPIARSRRQPAGNKQGGPLSQRSGSRIESSPAPPTKRLDG